MYRFPKLPATMGTQREVNTSKTSMEHAIAVVDDVPARTENRPQEPSLTNQVVNREILSKAPLDDA